MTVVAVVVPAALEEVVAERGVGWVALAVPVAMVAAMAAVEVEE
jgi:hypothetical protein